MNKWLLVTTALERIAVPEYRQTWEHRVSGEVRGVSVDISGDAATDVSDVTWDGVSLMRTDVNLAIRDLINQKETP